jgi:hypothetical protein
MGVFSFFRAEKPARQEPEPIKTIPADGTKYFLRVQNPTIGHDETLTFPVKSSRDAYINELRMMRGAWYWREWETTAEERLQPELLHQREQLEREYNREIMRLQGEIRTLTGKLAHYEQLKSEGSKYRDTVSTLARSAQAALNPHNVADIAERIERECPGFAEQRGLLQARCIDYYLQKIIDA